MNWRGGGLNRYKGATSTQPNKTVIMETEKNTISVMFQNMCTELCKLMHSCITPIIIKDFEKINQDSYIKLLNKYIYDLSGNNKIELQYYPRRNKLHGFIQYLDTNFNNHQYPEIINYATQIKSKISKYLTEFEKHKPQKQQRQLRGVNGQRP